VHRWRSASIELVTKDDLASQPVSVGAEQISDELGDLVRNCCCLIDPDRDGVDRDVPLAQLERETARERVRGRGGCPVPPTTSNWRSHRRMRLGAGRPEGRA
jgi:hypothetical protein